MIQRHYSPDQITAINHSLQKQPHKVLREAGSTSNLLSGKQTVGFKDDLETIGHYSYRKRDEIGSGYTSHVYKCRSAQREGDFAIKVIQLKKYSASSLEMLENQIQIVKKLSHPNIIKFEDVYKNATHCFLVTEFCPNGDLLEYMTNNGKLCEKEAINIISDVIEAAKYMFKMGVLHRDIKPANIFRSNKLWKLGDFGFSINSYSETKTRHNVGTPLYMPLQSLTRNIYSPQSDIFALGVILYEMIVGITPWECRSEKELIRKMGSVPFNVSQKYKLSSSLKYLLSKMCSINKQDRMSKDQFMELNIHNFNNLLNYSDIFKKSAEVDRKGRIFSLGKYNIEESEKSKPSQKQYQTNRKKSKNELKSVPKVEARAASKNKVVDVKVYGTSRKSSRSNSSDKKFQSKLQQKNAEILISQLTFCRFMYYLIENGANLPLNSLNRGRISLVLFKHILKIVKQMVDNKNNWFGFTNWDSYRKSMKYEDLYKTLKQYCEKYEKEYLVFLKKAEITVIKEVNQKLPQFSTNDQFTITFYKKIQSFVIPILKDSMQNVSNPKGQEGTARLQGLRSLYKYYKLIQLCMKQYLNFSHFNQNSNISILKDYRNSDITMSEYIQMRQEIKQL